MTESVVMGDVGLRLTDVRLGRVFCTVTDAFADGPSSVPSFGVTTTDQSCDRAVLVLVTVSPVVPWGAPSTVQA